MPIPAKAPQSLRKALVPGDALSVCGLFSAAAYLEAPDGGLILLHDEKTGLVPFGIALSGAETLLHTLVGPEPRGLVTGDGLELGGLRLKIEFLPERRFSAPRPSAQAAAEAVARGRRALAGSRKGALWDEAGVFAAASARARAQLDDALGRNDEAAVDDALLGLIGLGTGLTPSLDDYVSALCGLLNWARNVWGMTLPEAETLCRSVRRLAPLRTGKISAAYLLSAAEGQWPQRIAEALESVFSAESLERLLDIGGGSGGDLLAGLLGGMARLKL